MECVERIALKHIHYHVKNMISASLMHETGHPKSVLWDNIEGWGGGRWEEGSGSGGHMYTYGQFMLMYGKNHQNIVK